ncbi:MAG TPA: hypothetical protein VG321_05465, partial [Solirubrobacteraceae bacterium]|nr:hypothetical protein [Solirubrobacteraceae bacterium]
FALDASRRLCAAVAEGDEVPFEVAESDGSRRGSAPLYCYRPLTEAYVRERLGLLVALSSYAPVARALEVAEGTAAYLTAMGEPRISERPRDRADAALRCFVGRMFAERSEFGFEPDRFEGAYDELERALYQGQCVFEVVAPLLGVTLDDDSDELVIGEGLSLARARALADPPQLDLDADDQSSLLVLRVTQERSDAPPVAVARSRFRRVLTALRLFERGGFALGPIGSLRIDGGAWRPVALGGSGRGARGRFELVIPAAQEEEFRAFCNLIARRLPRPGLEDSGAGELAWALSRFEMGCERIAQFEALTDYLLALRALLEPEGATSGRLAGRLAVICAPVAQRQALAQRAAHAISLERAVVTGIAPAIDPGCSADGLVEEMAEHLRAILRDALCGHLDADVRSVADELLAEAAATPA